VPELAGNPFIMRIFQLFDADQDGCLNFEEFIRAVESFGRLYSSEDKCMCKWLSQLLQHQLFNLALPVSYNIYVRTICV
jgi:hypothetical protein